MATIQEVAQARGAFYKAAQGARLFLASQATAGVSVASLTIGTTAPFSLYNPADSRVNAVIRRVRMGYVSGTFGAGTLYHAVNSNPLAAASTGTAITTKGPGLVSGGGPLCTPLTTVTLPVAPTVVFPFAVLEASLATTAVPPWVVDDAVDGAIIIPPGCTWSIEGVTAAGTSPVAVFGVIWEEVSLEAA